MHELSIAQSLVELIEDELIARHPQADAARPFSVGNVIVKVGVLSGVVPEALASAFPVAISHSNVRGATLAIEEVPLIVFCPSCHADRQLSSPQRLRCPVCDTPTPRIVAGRELELVSIEVLDDTGRNDNDTSPAPHP